MKKRYYIGGLVLVVILLIVSYNLGSQSNIDKSALSKANKESQISSCAKQAEVILENEQKKEDEGRSYSQTNHYNISLSKCFVELLTTITDTEGVIFSDEVRDAYEQKTFIACLAGSSIDAYCFIPGNHSSTGQAINMTKEQGEAQIRDYMSN